VSEYDGGPPGRSVAGAGSEAIAGPRFASDGRRVFNVFAPRRAGGAGGGSALGCQARASEWNVKILANYSVSVFGNRVFTSGEFCLWLLTGVDDERPMNWGMNWG